MTLQETQIYSFKVFYGSGCGQSSGRIEATSAKDATDRLMARFQPFDRGTVTLLKNQNSARKGLFWAMKD